MKTYIINGERTPDLERILEEEHLEVAYRAKYVPVTAVRTDLELKALQEMLPDYTIQEQKELQIDAGTDDR